MDAGIEKEIRAVAGMLEEWTKMAQIAVLEAERLEQRLRRLLPSAPGPTGVGEGGFSVYMPGPPRVLRIVTKGVIPSMNKVYRTYAPVDRRLKMTMRDYWDSKLDAALTYRYGYAVEPFTTVFIAALFYFADAYRRDIDNYWDKSILDVLCARGVIASDDMRCVKALILMGGRSNEPSAEFVLTDSADFFAGIVSEKLREGERSVTKQEQYSLDPFIPINGSDDADSPF